MPLRRVICNRRVFLVGSTFMGLWEQIAAVGDTIAILKGCNPPLIFPKDGTFGELRGEAYIYSFRVVGDLW
jgi:hypothetical protein